MLRRALYCSTERHAINAIEPDKMPAFEELQHNHPQRDEDDHRTGERLDCGIIFYSVYRRTMTCFSTWSAMVKTDPS